MGTGLLYSIYLCTFVSVNIVEHNHEHTMYRRMKEIRQVGRGRIVGRALIVSGMTALLASSCSPREDIGITCFRQLQSLSDITGEEEAMLASKGLIEYDSVRFSDGSYAIHRMLRAPQNSLTEFFDSEGRTIATIARASECYAQTLVYGLDEEGRLAHLLSYKDEIFDGLEADSTSYGRSEEGYLGFRRMMAEIDYAKPDTSKYEQTDIEYGKDGCAAKAYVVYGSDSIVAPLGYRLEVAVKPCLSFWQSDLHGGFYFLDVTMEPKSRGRQEYRICRYVDFMPSVESYYRDGAIVKTVWHQEPGTVSGDKDLVFVPVREGALNVYTTVWTDGSKHQRAYDKGRLAYVQTISRYDTVLKKDTYTFLPDDKVSIRHEAIDYKTRTLKLLSVTEENVADAEKYREDMNVISGDGMWGNYYVK